MRLGAHRGAAIDVLDLSTLCSTGTFKDWVACVTMARALGRGQRTVLAQSSGNTANALARYAAHVGVGCAILYPPASRRRIQVALAGLPGVAFVEVDAPERRIKELLGEYASASGIPAVPSLHDQYEANKLRAYLLADAARELGDRWDWHVQALSSGYGPLGFYRGIAEIQRSSAVAAPPPRFLGIQQEAVAPYAGAIAGAAGDGRAPMIEPTLFRRSLTTALVDEMRRVCSETSGTVRCLSNRRYLELEPSAVAMLTAAGLTTTLAEDGTPRERAGLYSLAGALDAIDHRVIRTGDRVLVVYTGGAGRASASSFRPARVATPGDAHAVLAEAVAAARAPHPAR